MMYNHKKMLLFSIVLLIFLAACQAPPPSTPAAPSTESTEAEMADEESMEMESEDADTEMAEDEPDPDMEMEEEADDEAMAESEDEPATDAEMAEDVGTPISERTGPISEEEATELMYMLVERNSLVFDPALARILEQKDMRFASVLIETMRASQVGLLPFRAEVSALALQELTGENIGNNWGGWVAWYGGTDLTPPADFTTWKGELLGGIDPGFSFFLQSEFESTVRAEEIQWGGVRVDGIPALDQSPMIPAAEADYLDPTDAVFGLSINGDNRAYPLRIIDWHEMANDVVGGVPVSLAYCTLCGAAVAYDGRGSDGVTYDFGSSGFLFRSNKLMYDRQTRTLWNQLTGEPVLGRLVGTGVQLDLLPVVLTTWDDWLATHPDTQVLSIDTGWNRPYDTGAAYGDYFQSEEVMFPVWQRSDLLETKDQVYALTIEGQPKAYPIKILTEERVSNDTHAGQPVVLVSAWDVVQLEGINRRAGLVNYSPGAEVRAYDRGDFEFSSGETEDEVVDQDGTVWTVTEEALVSESGETLERLPGHLAFWFGWFAFFPNTEIYGIEG